MPQSNTTYMALCERDTDHRQPHGINSTFAHIETHFNTFANRADPDQAALIRAATLYGIVIRYYPTLVDLTSNFFVLCANMKVSLFNYSKWMELRMNIHSRKG